MFTLGASANVLRFTLHVSLFFLVVPFSYVNIRFAAMIYDAYRVLQFQDECSTWDIKCEVTRSPLLPFRIAGMMPVIGRKWTDGRPMSLIFSRSDGLPIDCVHLKELLSRYPFKDEICKVTIRGAHSNDADVLAIILDLFNWPRLSMISTQRTAFPLRLCRDSFDKATPLIREIIELGGTHHLIEKCTRDRHSQLCLELSRLSIVAE